MDDDVRLSNALSGQSLVVEERNVHLSAFRATMALIFNYFDNWKGAALVCKQCGWKGELDPAQTTAHRELFDFACPKCGAALAIVNFPTETEIKEHWGDLTEEEKQHYGQRFELDGQFEAHHLSDPDQLPDIKDDPLVLVWDFEGTGGQSSGPWYTAIKHLGRSIWRERAYFECVERFGQVVDVLQRKYGERLKDLIPTGASLGYLGGDDLHAWEKLEAARARMSPQSVPPEVRLHALASAVDSAAVNFLRYRREIGERCLQIEDQLPEIDGQHLVFGCTLAEDPPRVKVRCEIDYNRETTHYEWDKQSGDGFLYLSIFHEEREIWREAAPVDHPGRTGADHEDALGKRYTELAAILKGQYGSRVKAVVMTRTSDAYIGPYRQRTLAALRARLFPEATAASEDSTLQQAIQRAEEHGATVVRVARVRGNDSRTKKASSAKSKRARKPAKKKLPKKTVPKKTLPKKKP